MRKQRTTAGNLVPNITGTGRLQLMRCLTLPFKACQCCLLRTGFINISTESSDAGLKWLKRFCVLKNGRLDCYKDPLDDCIEFSVTVAGATLDLSDKAAAKRDLAVKISHNGQEVFLEVNGCNAEYINWLICGSVM